MRQTIAITTYNRKADLQSCLACLATAQDLDRWSIHIRDDASTEYDIGKVVAEAGISAEINRNSKNTGCDTNNVDLLRACLDAGAKRVFLLDSDMIVTADVLEFIDCTFARTDGVLSVYNSVLHPVGPEIDDDLIVKNSIGGAATVWDARLLRTILDRMDGPDLWDWQMCDIVSDMNIRLCVARLSRAQHVGMDGINSLRFGELDYGTGFILQTKRQSMALARALDTLMCNQQRYLHGPIRNQIKPPQIIRWKNSMAKRLPWN